MNRLLLLCCFCIVNTLAIAQTSPAIINWLQNTTVTGTFYVENNSTPTSNGELVNVQLVEYDDDYAYVSTTGIPAYATGPFLDNNPYIATNQDVTFKIPLNPTSSVENVETTAGRIGVFINGTSLFDYRDGVAWNTNTNALCGGPGNSPCPGGPMATQVWNRDAIPAEMDGFDCSKGHPAMGNYHHHQNPSAFSLDIAVASDICDDYPADGLYAMDASVHSPLLGFAYDGYPIYGAFGYANADGTGGVTRIKSSYSLGTFADRTVWADGTDVDDGPTFTTTYFNGYFREDYVYVAQSGDDYLDEHNGRFAITPEYPLGTYAYYATVDENWNSAYPYAVGPTFYGSIEVCLVTDVPADAVAYAILPVTLLDFSAKKLDDYVHLNWSTLSEINNDMFAVERSDNGVVFEEIATIDGAGTSTDANEYSYLDRDDQSGVTYYRLRQIDYDGKSSYSDIRKLNFDSVVSDVTIFPNPSSEMIAVQLRGLVRNEATVVMYDLKGNLVKTQIVHPGSTMTLFDTATLYDGTYIIEVTYQGDKSTHKVIVSHD